MAVNSSQGTPAWLGAVNDRTGLAMLLEHGPLTRNRICELAGVSKPTASLMMTRLEQSGFIVQAGRQTGTPGPSPIIPPPLRLPSAWAYPTPSSVFSYFAWSRPMAPMPP